MRIIHLSDIHVWRWPTRPTELFGKRLVALAELAAGRARRFELDRLDSIVARVRELGADHILITGDLTTSSLKAEFDDARAALAGILSDPERVSIVPGNHDRYTRSSARGRLFDCAFGAFAPSESFPWLRRLDVQNAVLGLDPCRPHLSATGRLPDAQLQAARELVTECAPSNLIVACHYPLFAPPAFRRLLAPKRVVCQLPFVEWLNELGNHIYCCGHIHTSWAIRPAELPRQLCLNAGAPLMSDRSGLNPPGFLEITITNGDVRVDHHGWYGEGWRVRTLANERRFFDENVDDVRD